MVAASSVPTGVSGSYQLMNIIEHTRIGLTSEVLTLRKRALDGLLPLDTLSTVIFLFPFNSGGTAADPIPFISNFMVLNI
jgi:hypothetical protein